MIPRPHWKGYLKLSLVSCPIGLYPAVSAAERISFRQVNKKTGHRLRQQLVDMVTGEVVKSQDKGRGYEVGEHQFLLVEDHELETARQEARVRQARSTPRPAAEAKEVASLPPDVDGRSKKLESVAEPDEAPSIQPEPAPVRLQNTRTIEIARFIPREQLDPRYFDTPYYVTPRDEVGQEAFAVIRDAMAAKGVVGIGRVTLSKRERPIIIQPLGNGLCGMTMRYSHEVRSASDYFDEIPQLVLPDDMLEVAERIIETKKADFDLALLEDRYRSVLVSMLRDKQAARLPHTVKRTAPSQENVINLMDVLKRSLDAAQSTGTASILKPPPRRTTAPARRLPAKRAKERSRKSR